MAKGIYNLNEKIVSEIDAIEKEMQEELVKVYEKYRPKISGVIAKHLPKGMMIGSVNGACFLFDKGESIANDGWLHLDEETSHNEHNNDILRRIANLQFNTSVDESLIDKEIQGRKI